MDISQKWNRRAFWYASLTIFGILFILSIWYLHFTQISSDTTKSSHLEISGSSELPSPEAAREQEIAQAHTQEEFKEMLPKEGETETEMIRRNLENSFQQTQKRTHEENLAELDRRGEQLNKYVSAESIDKISKLIPNWLNTKTRAEHPAETPPPGIFDFDTAQFHEIHRNETEDGKFHYSATLYDAQGRTMVVDLEESEGKPLWDVFQKMKKYPLMDQIYRKIVTSLLDKATAPQKTAPLSPNTQKAPDIN
ncbi:MAG: hypothetical protein Q4C96_06005 [Planctomycetia bacterium]|nr:hypothetical protein [Planctomycetia bacterium]